MTINGLSEMAHFPEQEVHEAVRRKDIFGVIGCIQVHIMKIVAISPPLYDIQGNVSNRVLAALTSESINIDRKQEKTLRELLQTVYRGMRSGNTRGDSIKRLLERGIPLLENIFTAEKSSAPTFQDIMPPPDTISPKDEPVVGEVKNTTLPDKIIPAARSKEEPVLTTRKSKYSSDNPPKIPADFHVDWETKKWRAFCLFYGYSPKTGKFDNPVHTRKQIAEILQMEDSDIAVCFSNNKKYLASWKPKPKKESKPARTLKQNPAKVKEKISKEKRTKKPQKPFSLPVSKIPKPTTVKRTEAEYDEEKEDDEVKYTNETLEVPDGIGDILKGCLRHAILSEHEEKELGNTIQAHILLKDSLCLTTELLVQIKVLIDYATPKIKNTRGFKALKQVSHSWESGFIISGTLMKHLYDLAKGSLLGNNELKKENADAVLGAICREMPTIAKEACDKLMIHNFRLVFHIAKDYRNYGLDIEDLFSEGVIGLRQAVLRFDPGFEAKFSTYAAWWIKQAIKRALANQSRIIRIPVHRQDKQQIFKRVMGIIAEELGREPTNEELSEELGIELKKIFILREGIKKPISLDAPIGSEDDTNHYNLIAASSQDDEDEPLLTGEEKQKIINLLNVLSPREKNIIERRFGLNGYQPQTLEEISREPEYSMTRERVRQIEAEALGKLRRKMGGTFSGEREIGHNNDFEDLKIARLAESVRQSTLFSHEKSILIGWCNLGKESVPLSMIAERNGLSYTQAEKMTKNALAKLPPNIKAALEIRGNSNL